MTRLPLAEELIPPRADATGIWRWCRWLAGEGRDGAAPLAAEEHGARSLLTPLASARRLRVGNGLFLGRCRE